MNTDIIPASPGLNLGHSNQRWNTFFQNVDIEGICTDHGQPCFGANFPVLQLNGVNTLDQFLWNVQDTPSCTWTNTSGGNIQLNCVTGGGNISPGIQNSQTVSWNPSTVLWQAQTKASYDIRDWGFVCNGTANNNAVAGTLLAAIGSSPANIQFTQQHCGFGDFVFPSNITLDFSPGGSIKTLTDSTTTPGTASFNLTAGTAGHCESNNTTPTCAMAVTATANDAYVIACMRGFSSGSPIVTSTVSSDIIVPLPGSDPGFVSVTMGWLIANVTGGARTFTATFPANLIGACSAIPITGLGPTPWLDGAGFIGSNVSTASPMSAGPATFQSGSFLIAWGGNNNTAMTCTAGAGFTQPAGTVGNSTNTNSSLCVEYKNSSSAGATTATQSFTVAPSGHAWSYEVMGLRPSSGRMFVQGNVFNPKSAQIFENATGTAGNISFVGSISPMRVKPEWWGGGSNIAAAINTGAVNAAISAAFPLNNQQYNKVLDLSGGIYQINDETQWYGTRGNSAARAQVDCGAGGGITQTSSNKRIMDAQGMAYMTFHNCQWMGSASSTLPLLDIDWTLGTAPSGTLKPQFLDFYTNSFVGNNLVDVGVLIAKSGGNAQGSNLNFFDAAFQSFTGSCLQIGGDNTGRNAGRFAATNAIQIALWGGDMQGCPLYGLSDYAGQNITIDGTTMENGFSATLGPANQTGFDAYSQSCVGGGTSIEMRNVRSESRRLIAGCNLVVKNSFTINQATFPTPGSSLPVGTIVKGSSVGWDGKYYRVTVDTPPPNLGGVGTEGAQEYASSGSATTIVNANDFIAGSLTSGSCTTAETMTQGVTGSTGTMVKTTASVLWISAHTGAPDNSHTWVGGTSGCIFTPTAVPVATAYTVNAFTGFIASVISGTNSGCYGVISSNTATAITVSSWITRFSGIDCPAPAVSSGFIVEPNWGTQFSSGNITWVDQNENGIEGQSAQGITQALIENADVPGDRINIASSSNIILRNVRTTRNDWANLSSGNAYQTSIAGNNRLDVSNSTLGARSGATVYQSWQLPRLSGSRTYLSTPFQDILGSRAFSWQCGDPSGSNGACNDKWIGGPQDATAGNMFGRNILPFCCLLGPFTPVGTDQNATLAKVGVTGGLSTGAGTPGDFSLMYGQTGGAGTQVNAAADAWLVKGGTGHFFAGTDNTFDIGATGASRPRNVYIGTQLFMQVATGTAPFSVTSTTPVANLTTVPTTYNHSGTQQTATHLVQDTCTLGTDCGVTLSGAAVYTNATSYTCTCQDDTAIASCRVNQTSGSAFTITGTGTDVIRYQCVGN